MLDKGPGPRNRSYILSESASERMAIAWANFMDLWRDAHGMNAIPGVDDLEEYLKPFLVKEILAIKWGTIRAIRDMRDELTDKVEHDTARDMMIANAQIEEKLLLKHL